MLKGKVLYFGLLAVAFALSTGIAHAQFTKAELQVSGLACTSCSKVIEKSLLTLDFISSVKADPSKDVFLIIFNSNVPVDLEVIRKKLLNTGFFVNMLKLTVNFNAIRLEDDHFTYEGNTYKLMNAENKALTGEIAVTLVDKGFALHNIYKKYPAPVTDNSKPGREYHIVI